MRKMRVLVPVLLTLVGFSAVGRAAAVLGYEGGLNVNYCGVIIPNLNIVDATVGDVQGKKVSGSASLLSCVGGTSVSAVLPNALDLSIFGPASGQLTGDVPVKWDFNLIYDNAELGTLGEDPPEWTLAFNISDDVINCAICVDSIYSFQTSGSGYGSHSGTGLITGLNGSLAGVNPTGWSIDFSVDFAGDLTIDIPDNTLSIPGAAAAVPEPATLGLIGAGLVVLAVIRRRRR